MRAAAERAGRNPDDIGLVAVTKYARPEDARELLSSGEISEVGENRVQDARRRKETLGVLADKARWRMIGHLQTNKAKQALEIFDAVDSLDNMRAAQALDDRLAELGRELPVLVQVKLSDKASQSGVAPQDLEALLSQLGKHPRLKTQGLMGIAPDVEALEEIRPFFRTLKRLFDRHFAGMASARLSMGMSRDFEIAIEEGSNFIRVGSAIFSPDIKVK